MVVCKYYQKGNCRYGQYCQYEHINNFTNRRQSLAQVVAEDVHVAEKGGQWILSCYGPLKDQPCIPFMEDLSPEEVRWQLYYAQKNGMVDEAKMQYQRLCQDMKTKRDALKNPTREIIMMLGKLENSGLETNQTANQSFPFSNLANNTSMPNSFSTKPFGGIQKNPFSSGFSNTANSNTNVFGRQNNSVFGAKPVLGNSIFGNSTASSNTVFGNMKITSTFGGTQNNSIFGGSTSQSAFGQQNSFSAFGNGTTAVTKTIFTNTTKQTSVFGVKSPTSIFGNSTPNAQITTNVFGSPFAESSTNTVQSVFQPKTVSAFGAPPVFRTSTPFSNSTFGSAPFGNPISGNAMVSEISNTGSTFSVTPQITNAFTTAAPVQSHNVFATQIAPFGTNNTNTPFSFNTPITSNSFSTISSPFQNTTAISTNSKNVFGMVSVTPNSITPFSTMPVESTFGNITSIPQPNINPTSTAITLPGNTASPLFNGPFKSSPFSSAQLIVEIDSNVYSTNEQLTEEEKKTYFAEFFELGKIPLNPPLKELR